jgi:peptide/nickel transport system substrate-binding protein
VWVADGEGREVAQVDPVANKVVRRIEAANAPRSLALAEGALWVVSGVDGSVYRIELDRPQAARPVRLGVRATAIAAGSGALWVASEEAGTVTRIDPRSSAAVASINVGNAPSALAVGAGAVWVVSRSEGTLARVDPGTNAMSGSVRVGTDLTGVAVGEGAVWVAGGEEGIVARVDPGDLRLVKKHKTGSSPSAVAVAGGSVWIAAVPSEAAHRGGTLRVDLSSTIDVAANSLGGYAPESVMVTSLAYDGLLAYRRVGGLASATLVGALATRPPAPSPDGRTYVFTLRSGLRYSDGTPVSAHDFRASMERYLSATRDAFPPFFAGIVGARRCRSGRGECDLSRGIESDQRTRTITVHLTAPDPDFLHKLTLPFAYVVLAGTPASRSLDLAPPGTGPYRFAGWHAPRGGELVRNAHFRPTAARPAGFADRIEITRSMPGRVEANVAAVQRGSADVTWVSSPFQEVRSRERLAPLVARAPGRLYSSASAGKVWMFLNTRRPPFDDVRVRRAVNFATDRAELVERVGGPEVAAPACQTIPAAFPGFSPYCPYTVGRARDGWIAPDLAHARRLIAESGTAGATVVVEIPEWQRPVGAYFVSLLRDLGFRARLHVTSVDEYFEGIFSPDSRAQMGWAGWVADYMSASNFIEPLFGCPTRADRHPENASRLCSKRVMTAIRRAQSSAPDDAAAAWAVADRRIVDLAAAVPYVDGRTAVIVSKRVGNVTHHPLYTTLLDRMWVR